MRGEYVRLVSNSPRPSTIAERWKRQYYKDIPKPKWYDHGKENIYLALMLLPDDATIEQIAKAIGNNSWTHSFCTFCSTYTLRAVEMGERYSSRPVCQTCIKEAWDLLSNQVG
jgi:hypothetical protein